MRVRRSALSEINVTSLVDVTMVLLIIFMITAPALQEWVDVKLPKATTERADLKEGLVVSIAKDRAIYLEKEKVTLETFDRRFVELFSRDKGRPVFLRADREVPYGVVVDVVGRIKVNGGTNLGLVVEGEER